MFADPVCIETDRQGLVGLNGAACIVAHLFLRLVVSTTTRCSTESIFLEIQTKPTLVFSSLVEYLR